MGWLIDPAEQSIFVYWPDQLTQVLDEPDALLPVPSFAQDVRLTVGQLFDWLLE